MRAVHGIGDAGTAVGTGGQAEVARGGGGQVPVVVVAQFAGRSGADLDGADELDDGGGEVGGRGVEERDGGEAVRLGEVLGGGDEVVGGGGDVGAQAGALRRQFVVRGHAVGDVLADGADGEHDGFHVLDHGGGLADAGDAQDFVDGDLELRDVHVAHEAVLPGQGAVFAGLDGVGGLDGEAHGGGADGAELSFGARVSGFPLLDFVFESVYRVGQFLFTLPVLTAAIGDRFHFVQEHGRLLPDLACGFLLFLQLTT